MKTIAVRILGSENEPVGLEITPDTTALDILTRMGLGECALVRLKAPMQFLQAEETVYN